MNNAQKVFTIMQESPSLMEAPRNNLDVSLRAAHEAELLSRKNQHRSDYVFPDGSALTVQHTLKRLTAWGWAEQCASGRREWVHLETVGVEA